MMAKKLDEWVWTDVNRLKKKPLKWLSEENFFRDPSRPMFSEPNYFFSPADGIILYQCIVDASAPIIDVKGKPYSVQDAMQNTTFDKTCLVIGIFMTMYDVHVNRVPYSGFLSYKPLEPIGTFNHPMLDIEHTLVNELMIDHGSATYLHYNQRVLNCIYTPELQQQYYVLQIADYDVNCIIPFNLAQNVPVSQNQRFSQIRFGSQVDILLPITEHHTFKTVQETGMHVEAGIDPLVAIVRKTEPLIQKSLPKELISCT